eukprot:6675656-Pyramimonas_sp.AAC.1
MYGAGAVRWQGPCAAGLLGLWPSRRRSGSFQGVTQVLDHPLVHQRPNGAAENAYLRRSQGRHLGGCLGGTLDGA